MFTICKVINGFAKDAQTALEQFQQFKAEFPWFDSNLRHVYLPYSFESLTLFAFHL